MEFELITLPKNCSKDCMLSEIRRVNSLINKSKLTYKDFNKLSKITARTISIKFGGWEKALIAAGLGDKYYGTNITKKMSQQSKNLTDEQILQELRRIANYLEQDFVTQENINLNSEIISGSTVAYRFGSWENGLREAGLKVSPGYKHKLSDEDYFENLLNVWTHYGRQPKYCEMEKDPSKISPSAYRNHFQTWRRTLEIFISQMNQKEQKVGQAFNKRIEDNSTLREPRGHKVTIENRRSINLSLRYKVLSRDNFRCVRCGSSPATKLDCKLHVDHILPFSKGGKTTMENLQTLCEKCNLGKGNRHSE